MVAAPSASSRSRGSKCASWLSAVVVVDWDKRNTKDTMAKTVETYRTTKALRDLVRRAAKVESKRPSEFLRQAAEEKARAVLEAAAREELRVMLSKLPPGRAPSDEDAERLGAEAASATRSRAK